MIKSLADFRRSATLWDDLWERSSCAIPVARSGLISQWVEQFASDSRLVIPVVESGERFLAALPLVKTFKAGIVSTGSNPSNAWTLCGQLLIDTGENADAIMDTLVSAFRQLPFSILWLDYIRFNDPEWILFKKSLNSLNIPSHWLQRYSTAIVPLTAPSQQGEPSSRWNKKQVADIRRRLKKYYPPGEYRFEAFRSPDEIQRLLPECFTLENKGWKGNSGSILRRGMDSFYLQQAVLLAGTGNLTVYTLRLRGELIAFQYCYVAKGHVFVQKLSYDPDVREYAPGQVLQLFINEELCNDDSMHSFDFVGELMPYQKIWNPDETPNGQIVLPLSTVVGKSFFFLYDTLMPVVRKLRYRKPSHE